jgi:hypothetical protein
LPKLDQGAWAGDEPSAALELELHSLAGSYGITEYGDDIKRCEELLASNSALRVEPLTKAFNQVWVPACNLIGASPFAWDSGDRLVTHESIMQFQTLWYDEFIPLFLQVGLSSVSQLHSLSLTFVWFHFLPGGE